VRRESNAHARSDGDQAAADRYANRGSARTNDHGQADPNFFANGDTNG